MTRTSNFKQRLTDALGIGQALSQNVIDEAVFWSKEKAVLRAFIKAKGHHFQHLLNYKTSFQSHQQSTEESTLCYASFQYNIAITIVCLCPSVYKIGYLGLSLTTVVRAQNDTFKTANANITHSLTHCCA